MHTEIISENPTITFITDNSITRCLLINKVAYIFKPSSSSYGMTLTETLTGGGSVRLQFVCQDGCCDRGLSREVAQIAEKAKELGAERIVLRMGQRGYYRGNIAGLSVSDVSNHVGEIVEGVTINQH